MNEKYKKMTNIVVYNSLIDHTEVIDSNLDLEKDFETLSDWCNDNIEENGFYELDEYDDQFIVQIDDDEPDWKNNFDEVVEKIKKYLNAR